MRRMRARGCRGGCRATPGPAEEQAAPPRGTAGTAGALLVAACLLHTRDVAAGAASATGAAGVGPGLGARSGGDRFAKLRAVEQWKQRNRDLGAVRRRAPKGSRRRLEPRPPSWLELEKRRLSGGGGGVEVGVGGARNCADSNGNGALGNISGGNGREDGVNDAKGGANGGSNSAADVTAGAVADVASGSNAGGRDPGGAGMDVAVDSVSGGGGGGLTGGLSTALPPTALPDSSVTLRPQPRPPSPPENRWGVLCSAGGPAATEPPTAPAAAAAAHESRVSSTYWNAKVRELAQLAGACLATAAMCWARRRADAVGGEAVGCSAFGGSGPTSDGPGPASGGPGAASGGPASGAGPASGGPGPASGGPGAASGGPGPAAALALCRELLGNLWIAAGAPGQAQLSCMLIDQQFEWRVGHPLSQRLALAAFFADPHDADARERLRPMLPEIWARLAGAAAMLPMAANDRAATVIGEAFAAGDPLVDRRTVCQRVLVDLYDAVRAIAALAPGGDFALPTEGGRDEWAESGIPKYCAAF